MKNGYVDSTNLTANIGANCLKGLRSGRSPQLIYTKNTMMPGLGGAQYSGYGYGNQRGNVGNIFSWLNTPAFYQLNGKLSDGTYPAKQESGNYLGANAFNPFFVQEYAVGYDNRVDILQDFDADYKLNNFVELDAKYRHQLPDRRRTQVTYLNQSTNINSILFSYDTLHGPYAGAYAPDNTGRNR